MFSKSIRKTRIIIAIMSHAIILHRPIHNNIYLDVHSELITTLSVKRPCDIETRRCSHRTERMQDNNNKFAASDCKRLGDNHIKVNSLCNVKFIFPTVDTLEWVYVGSRVVNVLDSGTERHGFKSQPRRCRVTVLGKLFTPSETGSSPLKGCEGNYRPGGK